MIRSVGATDYGPKMLPLVRTSLHSFSTAYIVSREKKNGNLKVTPGMCLLHKNELSDMAQREIVQEESELSNMPIPPYLRYRYF